MFISREQIAAGVVDEGELAQAGGDARARRRRARRARASGRRAVSTYSLFEGKKNIILFKGFSYIFTSMHYIYNDNIYIAISKS